MLFTVQSNLGVAVLVKVLPLMLIGWNGVSPNSFFISSTGPGLCLNLERNRSSAMTTIFPLLFYYLLV